MEKYKELLEEEITTHLITFCLLIVMLLAGMIFVIKLLNFLKCNKNYKKVSYVISALFFVGITIMTVISISKPLKDIKDSSFETYTGGIEFIEEKSSRYTFIYKLNDLNDVYLEADRDFTEAFVTKCEAKVVYAANSKKILELEVIED